jgi:ubiquinone/menaquinone biosynthesis C-methylase UbiE
MKTTKQEVEAEKSVSDFYNSVGWELSDGITEDAKLWEDLRDNSRAYISKCRLRLLRHIPKDGKIMLDMASGPIQFLEYLEYSRTYDKRYCVDLSSAALELAKRKIGEKGVFLHGSFFDLEFSDNFFDCCLSLHTIYHMDRSQQEVAVRKLLQITKPGRPVIIIYSNPNTLLSLPFRLARKFSKLFGLKSKIKSPIGIIERELYFYAFPISWWQRFGDSANVDILPWRAFASNAQKIFFPNNRFGGWLLGILFRLEDLFPLTFVKYFQYPMIILTKKK